MTPERMAAKAMKLTGGGSIRLRYNGVDWRASAMPSEAQAQARAIAGLQAEGKNAASLDALSAATKLAREQPLVISAGRSTIEDALADLLAKATP